MVGHYETQVLTPGLVILSIALGYKHASSINKKFSKFMNLPKESAKKRKILLNLSFF